MGAVEVAIMKTMVLLVRVGREGGREGIKVGS